MAMCTPIHEFQEFNGVGPCRVHARIETQYKIISSQETKSYIIDQVLIPGKRKEAYIATLTTP